MGNAFGLAKAKAKPGDAFSDLVNINSSSSSASSKK
jgi:hypothetical protein